MVNIDLLRIPLEDIVKATNKFNEKNLIKRGGLVNVYEGRLLRSRKLIDVIVRRFIRKSIQMIPKSRFLREVQTLSDLNHRNTISIVGFCDENGEMIMIIKRAVNGSLDKYLSDPNLTWSQRLNICLGVALALKHILQINGGDCHHDIKSSKILLDKDWEPMLFCFGFCMDYQVVFYETTIYTDPDFIKTRWSHNSDVYSFGVILFEVLCGRKALIDKGGAYKSLLSMVKHRNLEDMIDPNLRKKMHQHSLSIFSETAYNCLKKSEQRPNTNQVVERLREALEAQSIEETLEEEYAYLKIPHSDIMLATNDFAETYFIGSQRDGKLYKAELNHFDHRTLLTTEGKNKGAHPITRSTVILKRFNNSERMEIRKAFLAEIKMLTSCKNTKILSLRGFSWEGSEMILIYEGDFTRLHEYLRSSSQSTNPTWEQRIRICLDIVHGLKYLLNNIQPEVLHQRIQSANVLLDEKWNAKIANFRLSIFESQLSAVESRRIRDPNVYSHSRYSITDEYYMLETKQKVADLPYPLLPRIPTWTDEDLLSDSIYSIGVIFFEILTGSLANDLVYMSENVMGLAPIARRHFEEGRLKNIVDRKIMEEVQESSFNIRKGPKQDSLDVFSNIAYKCLAKNPSERPTLEVVIEYLEKALQCQVQNFESLKIPLQDIKLATGGFAKEYKIGSGGYGEVYKGELDHFDARSSLAMYVKNKDELPKKHGTVAIKRILSRDDGQGKEGFLSELEVLSRCEHPNIVSLVGFCVEGQEMILVYEFASNGSLDNYLENPSKESNLTWARRLNMCIEIALGLYYLHTTMEDKRRIIHRDIKSANILMGENFIAKIADFGLSKIHFANQQGSTINTNVAGTNVYLDPEYLKTNKLKKESDIYSFGVVLFEILSGTVAYHSIYMNENIMGLAPVVRRHMKEGTLNEIIDSEIMDEAHTLAATLKIGPDESSLNAFTKIAYQCLAETQCKRPPIQIVIEELRKALEFQVNRKYPYQISREDIKLGTENFSVNNCIVRGVFGTIYNGQVEYESGQKNVAVKRFSRSGQEHGLSREFEVLFKHKHENIIGLEGYCKEMDEEIIIYEHAANGSLDRHLKDPGFTWTQRLKICIDIAKGLNFLHGGDTHKEDVVTHRDIKSSNILLTGDWKAKICGFELSLISPINQDIEYVMNDVVGSPGYCDPLYWETGFLTKESDIYSLGVVLFEMLCGRLACPENQTQFLDDLVRLQYKVGRLDEIVFEGIARQIALKSLATFRRIAFQCLQGEREERPTAGEVVVQLQNALEFQEEYDKVWDAKLPKNYKDILDLYKSPEICSTDKKREIYNTLSKGIFLQQGNMFFSIGANGERNEMISARVFSYKIHRSRKWRIIQGSRFQNVAEMLDISNLKIRIKIKPQLLSPDVDYRAYLVFKFCGPRKSVKQMYVNLKYKIGHEDLHTYFATCREDDDWMQIELYQSKYDKADTNLVVSLESFSRCYCDSRAIYIEGIEFRAVDHVKQEEIEKFDQNQQGKTPNTEMDKLGVSLSEMKSKRNEVPAGQFLYDSSNKKLYPPSESSAGGIIELPRHQVFSIKWSIESQKVTQTTEYVCYLVFKLSANCSGLHGPVIIRDQFSKKTKNTVYFRSPSPWNIHDTNQVPKKRSDGWMEVIVWKFNSNIKPTKDFLSLHLKLISYEGTMSGLIVRSIEFGTM